MKKLKARIANGDEKLLQSVRKKIIDELKEKDGFKKNRYSNDQRNFRREETQQRFNNFDRRDRFRPHNDSLRNNFDRNNTRNSFPDRFEPRREK